MTLTAVELAALSAAVADKAAKQAKGELTPGKCEVDFTVRVTGTVSKGEDTEAKPTTSMPWLTVLALLVHRAGFQREGAMELIKGAMADALVTDGDAATAILAASGVADAKAQFDAEVLEKLPKVPVQGCVTCKVTVTPVEV